ncbi:MAG: NUDIX hydrolase [Actinomycetota bacterium]|nr:NUDIX hydrolase [Actinomycetota bacterium]
MPAFRKLSEQQIWEGAVITVAQGRFASPDGDEFERDVVHHPGAVSVVPFLEEERAVLLLRQYRAAVDGELLEIPAGKLDVDGEGTEATARRELEEEVGLRAGRLEKLGQFYNSPGFSDEYSVVYLGRELERCQTSLQGVEEQHMTVEHVALDDVPGLIASGQIVDAKTIIGLCLAREALA